MAIRRTSILWESFLNWLYIYRIGDITSLVGIVISVLGFSVTIYNVFRSKNAAERAEEASNSTRNIIKSLEAIVNFTEAISTLEQIKKAHREKNWTILPEKYSEIRKILILLRPMSRDMQEHHQAIIQNTLVNLREIEKSVERYLSNTSRLNAAKFNSILTDDIDGLIEMLADLKEKQSRM